MSWATQQNISLRFIQQQQQQLLNENQRQREELERSVTLPETVTPKTPARTEGPCFMISRIDIDGATKLSATVSAKLTAPWVNQCLNIPRQTPVEIEILPGSQQGVSIVNLTATPEFPLAASVSFDNSGQKSTGVGQINGGLTGNNLLGLADSWYISGGRSSAFSNSEDAQNFAAGVSVPYGYSLLDYSYSWNNYLSTIDNNGYLWRSSGDTETHRVNLSHVLFRNGDIKTGVSLGLSHRINHNWLDDVLLQSSSRKLTSLLFGLNHTQKMFGGVATFNPTFSRGMPWLDAEIDGSKNGDLPKAQFRKWSLNASFQRPVAENLWWLASAYGQWSPDRLYGSERMTIGGESSVRGFKEQTISGDNGAYWRNELNYTLFTLPVIGQVSALTFLSDKTRTRRDHMTGGGAAAPVSAGRETGDPSWAGHRVYRGDKRRYRPGNHTGARGAGPHTGRDAAADAQAAGSAENGSPRAGKASGDETG